MKPDLTNRLCTKCGLCCDGSLFSDVELTGSAEASGLEAMGLEVEDDDGGLLVQPCGALEDKRCNIYAHRPACCRTFECRLLQEVRRGRLDVARAEKQIAETVRRIGRIRAMGAELGPIDEHLPFQELCAEILATAAETSAGSAKNPMCTDLEVEMNAVKTLIRTRFLGDGGKRRT